MMDRTELSEMCGLSKVRVDGERVPNQFPPEQAEKTEKLFCLSISSQGYGQLLIQSHLAPSAHA